MSLNILSAYSSKLTTNSDRCATDECDVLRRYCEVVQISVVETGYYTITSNSTMNMHGHLYESDVNIFDLSLHSIADDDDSGFNQKFSIEIHLQLNITYMLVLTTSYPNVTGPFSILIYGPKNVSMNRNGKSV